MREESRRCEGLNSALLVGRQTPPQSHAYNKSAGTKLIKVCVSVPEEGRGLWKGFTIAILPT